MSVRSRSGSDGINQSSCSSIRSLPLSVLTLISSKQNRRGFRHAGLCTYPPTDAGGSELPLLFSRFTNLNRFRLRLRFGYFTHDVAIASLRRDSVG
jgi:hypothetical protein